MRTKQGNKRWIIWGLLALIYAFVFFHRLSIGVMREDLMSEFSINAVTFANIGATYFYVYLIMQIPSGILVDFIGAKRLIVIGTLVAGVGSMIFSIAPKIVWIFIGRFIVGLGVSVIFVSILKIQSELFEDSEFATVTGMTSLVGNLGGVFAQMPLALLLYYFSWRITFLSIGILTLVLAIIASFMVENDFNLQTQNNAEQNLKENFKVKLSNILRNKHTWPPFIVFAVVFGSYVAFTGTWGLTYLMEVYDIGKIEASKYTFVATISLAISCVVIGKLSDTLKNRKKIVVSGMFINVLSWITIVYGSNVISNKILMVAITLMGASCSIVVICFTLAKELNPPNLVGTSTSVVNMGGFAGATIIPVMIGNYIDKYQEIFTSSEALSKSFVYCVIATIIGLFFSFIIKETNGSNIYDLG